MAPHLTRFPLAPLLALLLTLPACDDGTPPPPPSPAATTTPAAAASTVTPADLHGDWVMHPADVRSAAFNAILSQVERAGRDMTDREIEQHVPAALEHLLADPFVYTFHPGGNFTAAAGPDNTVTGAWTLKGDLVTITSDTIPHPIHCRLIPDELTGVPGEDTRRRTVTMIRKS